MITVLMWKDKNWQKHGRSCPNHIFLQIFYDTKTYNYVTSDVGSEWPNYVITVTRKSDITKYIGYLKEQGFKPQNSTEKEKLYTDELLEAIDAGLSNQYVVLDSEPGTLRVEDRETGNHYEISINECE